MGEALASLQASARSSAEVIATGQFEVQPDLNTSQKAIFAIGEPVPAVGLLGLMFGFVISGVNGTVSFRPVFRTMDRADQPGAWDDTTLVGTDTTATTNDRINSGDLTLTAPAEQLIQVGVEVSSTTARAAFQVLVSGRY